MEVWAGSDECLMTEDDSRMPQVVATEEVLKNALSPFKPIKPPLDSLSRPMRAGHPDSDDADRNLRKIMTMAADLAIMAFADPAPTEFYWPTSNRRKGYGPDENDGMLECFGVRQRDPVPGLEGPGYPVTTIIRGGPGYNDSIEFGNVHEAQQRMNEAWKRLKQDGNWKADVRERERLETRQKKSNEFRKMQKDQSVPSHGWEGGKFWQLER